MLKPKLDCKKLQMENRYSVHQNSNICRFLPLSRLLRSFDRQIEYAALIVPIKDLNWSKLLQKQPNCIINCKFAVGQLQGLLSVVNVIAIPLSIIFFLRLHTCFPLS